MSKSSRDHLFLQRQIHLYFHEIKHDNRHLNERYIPQHSCQPQLTQIRNQAFENAEIAIILWNPLKSYGFIQTMLKVPIRCRDRCIGLHNIDKHF